MATKAKSTDIAWRKSSYSNGSGGNCVEVAASGGAGLLVRDSKRPSGPVLAVGAGAWGAFLCDLHLVAAE